MLYWVGYKFGRYTKEKGQKGLGLEGASEDEKMEAFATLLRGADDEFPAGEAPPNPELTSKLDQAVADGVITEDERQAVGSFRGFLRRAAEESKVGHEVTKGEKGLLKKWKSSGKS